MDERHRLVSRALPDAGDDGNGSEPHSREERQVRLTAQRILADHLWPGDDDAERGVGTGGGQHGSARFWDGIRIDLTGATLIDFDFSDTRISEARFYQATFIGSAAFRGETFTGVASFAIASFRLGAYFTNASFLGSIYFGDTSFNLTADFRWTTFIGDVRFEKATFTCDLAFNLAGFTRDLVDLTGARAENLTGHST